VILVRYPLAAVALLSLALLGLSLSPPQRQAVAAVRVEAPKHGLALTLSADLPVEVRLGQAGDLRLTTETGAAGTGPSDPALVLASLDSACLTASPPGDVIQRAVAGQSQTWHWRLDAPENAGACPATLRVSLRPVAGAAGGTLVWVKEFSVIPTAVLGLPAPTAQAIGFIGSAAGLLALAAIEIRQRAARRRLPHSKTG
jgi:hypothetical protein